MQYNCLHCGDDLVIIYLSEIHDQSVLKYILNDHSYTHMIFYIWRNKFNIWTEWHSNTDDILQWHLWLEHSDPQALEHLVNASKNVWIKDAEIKEIKTVKCNACEISKAKCQIWWKSREIKQKSEIQLALDFHDLEDESYSEYKCQLLITNCWSDLMWDYYLTDHKSGTILEVLKHLLRL